jgi:hypothetical protein
MSNSKIVIVVIAAALAAGGFYAWKEFTRTNKDLSKTKADFKLNATDLINEFEKNDSTSSVKYAGKILEITGNVKKTEKDDLGLYTLILGDRAVFSSVRCTMDTNQHESASRVPFNSSVTIRGACNGYNKDELGLGSDVILNRCVLLSDKK